jgi:pimeloyl-ACP methyl ester carboxylesterase
MHIHASTNDLHSQQRVTLEDTLDVAAGCPDTKDDIDSRLSRIWQEILGIDSLGLDENYFDLGGDSALTIQLFAQVEKAFKIKVPLPMLFEAPTVREFAEVLRRAGAEQGVSSLVPIQPTGSRPAFFCVHGPDGEVSMYEELAHHLSPEQPFYGLQSQGLDGKHPPLTTIEDMAARYLKEIRKLQPQGPYFLGGHSMGGTIAFEIAQRLQRSGEVVGLLALFDTGNWPEFPTPSLVNKAYDLLQRWKLSRGAPSEKATSESLALRQVLEANRRAWSQYVPHPYVGTITDFRSLKQSRIFAKKEMQRELLAQGGQEIVTIPVHPTQMLKAPFVKHLATALSKSLDMAISKVENCRAELK